MGDSWVSDAIKANREQPQRAEASVAPTVHMDVVSNGAEVSDRLVPLPPVVHVGRFALGADQYVLIAPLVVRDGFLGKALIEARMSEPERRAGVLALQRTNAFGPDVGPGYTEAVNLATQLPGLRARFHPQEAGRHEEILNLKFTWSDGRVTKQNVLLIGIAHDPAIAQDPIPRPDVPAELDEVQVNPANGTPTPDRMRQLTNELTDAAGVAALKMEKMARQQYGGMIDAQKMAASYKEAPGDAEFWTEIGILAVTMATGGLVGAISKLASKAVQGWYKDSTMQSFIETFMSDGVKEGMKHAIGKKDKLPKKHKPVLPTASEHLSGAPTSSNGHAKNTVVQGYTDDVSVDENGVIAFWSTQDDMLTNLQDLGSISFHKTKMSLLEKMNENPEGAVAAMKSIADGLTSLTNTATAKQEQTRVSLSEWVSGLHRAALGTVMAEDTRGNQIPVSNMNEDMKHHDSVPNALLDLQLSVDTDGSRLTRLSVVSGTFVGVSQETLNELSKSTFGQLRIPTRLTVWSSGGTVKILRDEAGRVRCSGYMPSVVSGIPANGDATSADLLPFAESVFEALADKKLAGFNLGKRMHHNDGTGLGDQ